MASPNGWALEGVYPNHKDVERVKPAGGRFINDIDIRQRHKAVERMGFAEMTEIQEKTIPVMLAGHGV